MRRYRDLHVCKSITEALNNYFISAILNDRINLNNSAKLT
jgi:hypothetical protein